MAKDFAGDYNMLVKAADGTVEVLATVWGYTKWDAKQHADQMMSIADHMRWIDGGCLCEPASAALAAERKAHKDAAVAARKRKQADMAEVARIMAEWNAGR